MRGVSVRDVRHSLYWPVLLPAALLVAIGLWNLSGVAIYVQGVLRDGWHLLQLRGIAIGVATAFVVLFIPYKAILSRAYLIYALHVLLLGAVLLAPARNQSTRWISLGGLNLQPSEFMKLALILTLARYIRFRSSYKTFKGLGVPFLLTLGPMALILKQPDLGTALLCVPILFSMLFAAGARLRHLLLIVILGAMGMYPVYQWGLRPYQKARITGFFAQISGGAKPEGKEEKGGKKLLAQGQNFQIEASKVAIGQGGWVGSSATGKAAEALFRVPERQTDFIFAVVAAQSGFLGCLLLLVTYVVLLLAILLVALRHRDPAARLLCVGIFALFAFQGLINIAMTVGLMPITGMTLPLISYGGSSMLVSIVGLALVCNVAARPSYEFGRGDFD